MSKRPTRWNYWIGYLFAIASALPLQAVYVQSVAETRVREYTKTLLNQDGHPTPALVELLRLVGMDTHPSDTLPVIHTWAQQHLIRHGERWHQQTERFKDLEASLLPLLEQLGFTQSHAPTRCLYEGALIHGALLSRVRSRLASLVKTWEEGVRFAHLYLLSGARPLERTYEHEEALCSDSTSLLKIRSEWTRPSILPTTESEMMGFVWDQADLPEDMRNQVQVHIINRPMKEDPLTHAMVRPNTQDTIEEWLKHRPIPGHYLAVTNAPYIVRQNLVMQALLPQELSVETIGDAISSNEKIVILLDELARTLFLLAQPL